MDHLRLGRERADRIGQSSGIESRCRVLDSCMPVMNGLETARHLGRDAPGVAKLLTLHASEQLQREAEALGIKRVLSKSDGVGQSARRHRSRLLRSLRLAGGPT
jgi:CheY-like chemotaxis protein